MGDVIGVICKLVVLCVCLTRCDVCIDAGSRMRATQ